MNKLGLYIHIPFCQSRCYYCDFTSSVFHDDKKMETYVENIVKELDFLYQKFDLKNYELDTIYFGGGTPSLLKIAYFRSILENIFLKWPKFNGEFTIEANPSSLTKELILDLKKMGLNRISIGVQSLNDNILNTVGRVHDSKKALDIIKMCNEQKVNISCDMMIGLPGQTKEDIKYFINGTTSFENVNHISSYMLSVEDGTKLKKLVDDGTIELMSEDEKVDLFDYAISLLEEKKYLRYEVSNFAKIGYESKHNLKYWSMDNYIGLGVSAHSLIGNLRFYNSKNFDEYYKNINNQKIEIEEKLNKLEYKEEYIMLALRTVKGINLKDYFNKFNTDFIEEYKENLNKVAKYLNINNTNVSIKKEFLSVINSIILKIL